MSESKEERRSSVRRKAQNHFTSEQRDNLLKKEIETERAVSAAKTARLKALRLAKEAADKEEADKLAEERGKVLRSQPAARKMRRAPGH